MKATFDTTGDEDKTCYTCGRTLGRQELCALVHKNDGTEVVVTHVDLRCEMAAHRKLNPEG